MSDYYDKKIQWRYKMKTVRFSKRFFVSGGVLLLLFAFILVSSNLSYTQQKIKRTVTPRKLSLKNDLTIKIVQCPKNVVKAGEELKAGFQVVGKSTFAGPVNGVVVDIILTSNPTYPAPAPYAVASANYSDNVLLKGGREHISFTGPGNVNVPLNGSNTIPADTPSGIYYLGAVIDAGNKFSESNERNNVHFCRLRVIGSETKRMPDLIISSMDFKKVQQRYDAKKQPYWIFNVIITVKNQGNANAGPFKVLLERNVGAGGSFTQACQTCVIGVQGLGAGQSTTLPPRQFNNANNANSKFRATADISNTVPESNETNNSKIASF
jgi:hypothetical protein